MFTDDLTPLDLQEVIAYSSLVSSIRLLPSNCQLYMWGRQNHWKLV